MEWMEKMTKQQAALPKHAAPVLLASQILQERDALSFSVMPIMNKPKPKVEAPKEPVPEAAKPEVVPEADPNMEVD
jgi:heat shock protein 4